MFGGLGGHNNGTSTNDGALVIVNQTTAAVTIVGHPAGISRISGLAFDLSGNLYASTQPPGGFPPPPGSVGASQLLQLNPGTGAILLNVPFMDGATAISIADLAVQPGTGALYAIRSPADGLNGQGKLYTVNKTTGACTLVGNTGHFFASIAFAANGTLYMTSADLDPNTDNQINFALKTLNPANAAELTSKPAAQYYGALGVRPEDGVIFAGNGDQAQIFTLNPNTGAQTLVGSTGSTFVGDLAFQFTAAIPTLSEWGMLLFAVLLVSCGALYLRKPRFQRA